MGLIKESWKYLQTLVYKVINSDLSLVQLETSSLIARPLMGLLNPFGNMSQVTLSRKDMAHTKNNKVKHTATSEPFKPLVLSKQELLEVSQNISLYYAPRVSIDANKLVLLSIDPEHLYAYWRLSDNDRPACVPSSAENEMLLRVYSQEKTEAKVKSKLVADFVVKGSQSKQVITLPAPKKTEIYFARLGKLNPIQEFIPLIKSNDTSGFKTKEVLIEINSVSKEFDTPSSFKTVLEDVNSRSVNTTAKKSYFVNNNNSGIGRSV